MRLLFDSETDGLLDELTKVHCIAILDLDNPSNGVQIYHDDPELVCDGDLECALYELADADEVWAHNAFGFDIRALQKVYPSFKPRGEVHCTLVRSRLAFPDLWERDCIRKYEGFPSRLLGKHSLESWGQRLTIAKDDYSGGWEHLNQDMLDYCVQDVRVLAAVHQELEEAKVDPRAIDIEERFANRIEAMNRRRIWFDREGAEKLEVDLSLREIEVKAQLREAFDDFVDREVVEPSLKPSYKIPALLQVGWEPKEYTDTGKPRLTKAILERLTKDSNKKLATVAALFVGSEKELTDHVGRSLQDLVGLVVKETPVEFNPSSRAHLVRALQEQRGWVPTEFTDADAPKFDEDVIEHLDFEDAPLIQESFMLDKRLGQLARGKTAWLKLEKDGYIQPKVLHIGTVYGRCSHSRPNVTQVPKVTKPYGKRMREFWQPRPGYVMLGTDLAGADLRILGHLLVPHDGGAFRDQMVEGDIHTYVQEMVGLDSRDKAKTLEYASLFGAKAPRISKAIGVPVSRAKKIQEMFMSKLKVKDLDNGLRAAVKSRKRGRIPGYLYGLDGRKIPITQLRLALNYVCAGGTAVLCKLWTCLTLEASEHLDRHLLIHAHDELQIEVRPHQAEELGEIAKAKALEAGEILGLRVPTPADVQIGRNWSETH